MSKKHGLIVAALVLSAAGLASLGRAVQPPQFDRLTDEDRQAFARRFEKEVWPLLTRNGKSGCVGCHSGKVVTALRYSGDPQKDFAMLLKEGFFLYGDDGSLLARVTDPDPERRMPLDRKPWAESDVEVLRRFTADLHRKQQK